MYLEATVQVGVAGSRVSRVAGVLGVVEVVGKVVVCGSSVYTACWVHLS